MYDARNLLPGDNVAHTPVTKSVTRLVEREGFTDVLRALVAVANAAYVYHKGTGSGIEIPYAYLADKLGPLVYYAERRDL